jgi:broad specificity phosphatase PhoE
MAPIHILAVSHGAWIAQLVNSGLIGDLGYTGGNHTSSHRVLNTSITIVDVHTDQSGNIPVYAAFQHLLKPVVKKNADDINEQPVAEKQEAVSA